MTKLCPALVMRVSANSDCFTIKRLDHLPGEHLLTFLHLSPAVELLATPPAVTPPLLLLWFCSALKVVFHPSNILSTIF